jgi:hypothetical protein
MIAVPWYLSALGLALILVGWLTGAVFRSGSRTAVDSRMNDAEIARRLNRQSSLGFPGFLMLAGLLCLAAGVVWRLLRMFIPGI